MPQALPPPTTTVEAVEVQPARLPPAISEQAFSVIRLQQEDIEGNERVDQALQQAPGVGLFRRTDSLVSNPTTQGISLRSIAPSGAGRALVTLDGVPLNDPFGGWVIWAGIPTDAIGGATVVRGGGAGPYGAGALTGVIALDERTDGGMEASARYGTFNSYRGSFVGNTSMAGADVMLAAAGGSSDGYVPVFHGAGAADTKADVEDWSVLGRVLTNLGDGRLSIQAGAFDEDRGSGLALANAGSEGQHASVTWAQAPAGGSLGFRAQGWVRTSDLYNTSVSTPANRASTTLTNNQFATPSTGYGFNGAVRGGSENRQWEVGADYRYAKGETQEQFSITQPGGPFTRYAGGKAEVAGLYVEGALQTGNDWLFTGGLRVDQWSNSEGHRNEFNNAGTQTRADAFPDREGALPTARLAARHNMDWGYARAAAYTGFRAPTLNELHRPFRVGNISTEANAALAPERIAGGEVGMGIGDEAASLDVTIFYNELTDAITNVTTAPNTRQRQNAGTVKATGLEAEGAWRMDGGPQFRAAVAYTDAETEAGLRPAQTARFSATAGVDVDVLPQLNLGANLRYEGDRFDDDLNTTLLKAATVVDLQAAWDFGRGVEGFLAVDNAFDEEVENGLTSGAVNYASPRVISAGIRIRR